MSFTAAEVAGLVREACTRRDLDPTGLRLVHHYSSAVCVLPVEDVVARLTLGETPEQVTATQTIVAHLGDRGVPVTAPHATATAVEVHGAVVSFWEHYPQPHPTRPLTSRELAGALKVLHGAPSPPLPLVTWTPLVSAEATLRHHRDSAHITSGEIDALLARIDAVRIELAALDYPCGHGLIHGDAWAGNLLWRGDTPVLGDWDWVAYGPREVDLIPTWHAATRYGKGRGWAEAFAAEYGVDLTGWSGFAAMLRMRDLVQLSGPLKRAAHSPTHAAVLRQRVNGILGNDTASVWTAL